jgi:hypothetical protein
LQDAPLNNPAASETVLLEWTVHLLRRDPARARVVVLAMLLSSAIGVWLFRSPLFLLLGPLLLFSATAEYLLPIRYRLTNRRVCAAYGMARLEIAWDRVKRRDIGAAAVKLSPFAVPNRLDNFRGVVLRFDDYDQRHEVLRIIDERIAASRQVPAESAAQPTGALS